MSGLTAPPPQPARSPAATSHAPTTIALLRTLEPPQILNLSAVAALPAWLRPARCQGPSGPGRRAYGPTTTQGFAEACPAVTTSEPGRLGCRARSRRPPPEAARKDSESSDSSSGQAASSSAGDASGLAWLRSVRRFRRNQMVRSAGISIPSLGSVPQSKYWSVRCRTAKAGRCPATRDSTLTIAWV